MDENSVNPINSPGKKRRRKILGITLLVLIAAAGSFFALLFFTRAPDRHIYGFVPEDAIYILESREPVDNWKEFSESKIWTFLRKNPTLEYFHLEADTLDQMLKENDALMQLVGERTLLISAHMLKEHPDGYDFLYLFDLKKGAKVSFFKDVIFEFLQTTGDDYEVYTKEEYEMVVIRDPKEGDLFLSFSDNILVMSYSENLVIRSRKQGDKEGLDLNKHFVQIDEKAKAKGPFRIFLNYEFFDEYLTLYMDEVGESLSNTLGVLRFSVLDIQVNDDFGSMTGYTNTIDSSHSMVTTMLAVEGSKIKGDVILPPETSFFLRIGFEDFEKFYDKIWENLAFDPAAHKEYKADTSALRKKLKINFKSDLTGWIGNEVMVGMLPLDEDGFKQAYFGVFHANNRNDAERKMDFLIERLEKKAHIIKVRMHNYKGYDIRYIDMKGFFKFFFGKLWRKYEKPHYFLMQDFVVFSNDTVALHRFIDAEDKGESLAEDEGYQKLRDEFGSRSNIFGYINNTTLYGWLKDQGDPATQLEMDNHRPYMFAFPRIGFQLNQDHGMYQTDLNFIFEEK